MKRLLLLFLFTSFIGTASAEQQGSYVSKLPDCAEAWHNCFGIYNFESGDKYVGEWKYNKRHGQGTYAFASGNKYVGEWKDGNYHSHGTLTFSNGDKYVGEFKNNKFNGQGIYTFASGAIYAGEWKDDKKHGQGTYLFADGDGESGTWVDNELVHAKKHSKPNNDTNFWDTIAKIGQVMYEMDTPRSYNNNSRINNSVINLYDQNSGTYLGQSRNGWWYTPTGQSMDIYERNNQLWGGTTGQRLGYENNNTWIWDQ